MFFCVLYCVLSGCRCNTLVCFYCLNPAPVPWKSWGSFPRGSSVIYRLRLRRIFSWKTTGLFVSVEPAVTVFDYLIGRPEGPVAYTTAISKHRHPLYPTSFLRSGSYKIPHSVCGPLITVFSPHNRHRGSPSQSALPISHTRTRTTTTTVSVSIYLDSHSPHIPFPGNAPSIDLLQKALRNTSIGRP